MKRPLKLYCVFDTRAEVIVGPIVHDHSAVPIIRQVKDAVNNPQTMIGKNPEDFIVVEIGVVDEATAELVGLDQNRVITTALALREDKQ